MKSSKKPKKRQEERRLVSGHSNKPLNSNAQTIFRVLAKEYKGLTISLDFKNPLQLLIATILSAQCTDKRVNIVTKDLFVKYKSVKDFAKVDSLEFEDDIRSTGFYRNKTKNIIAASKKIIKDYGSRVPNTMDELLTLPGVARKTANIVLINAFDRVEGIPVDTHVRRLSLRLHFTFSDNPIIIEKNLMSIFVKSKWQRLSDLLIEHGRNVCFARSPRCTRCIIKKYCPSKVKTTPKAA